MVQASVRESVHPAHSCFELMRDYRHPILLNKMQAELGITCAEAETLFEDVKKFLALCVTSPQSQSLAPTKALDQGWHTFILFTKDYAQFCKDYCGRYVHHHPEDPFAETKDFESIPRTRRLAMLVFGKLSANWQGNPLGKCSGKDCSDKDCSTECNQCSSCKQSVVAMMTCQGKDCSPGDCTSCKGAP